jgi:hypothetical protein
VSGGGDVTYRVMEVSPVAEEPMERALNLGAAEGWTFESVHFVTREGSHRPALAYLFLVRRPAPRKGKRP